MTKFHLIHFPQKDKYIIRTTGIGKRYCVIYRKDGWSDTEFREAAIKQFDDMLERERSYLPKDALEAYVIKTDIIF